MRKLVFAIFAAAIVAASATQLPTLLAQAPDQTESNQMRLLTVPGCLHDTGELPADAARRAAAVRLARSVNTAEARALASARNFVPLGALAGIAATPPGFTIRFAADGQAYAFSIKDSLDPCGFTLFSDQDGVIYVGAPMQPTR